jgi:hypothetical protein
VRDSTRTLPDVVEVDEDGRVTYRQRLLGTFACPLDLRRFPFDRQELFIQLVSAGHTPEEVQFVIDDETGGRAEKLSITDWSIGAAEIGQDLYTLPQSGRQLPGISIRFGVERLARYYAGTIFATVGIILCMAWLVYWLPLTTIPPRVSVSVTSMLSLIAYRFVAAQDLPRLPYLTRMDFFLLGAAALVLVGLAGVVAVAHLHTSERVAAAKRLNRAFQWGFPVFCVLLILGLLL